MAAAVARYMTLVGIGVIGVNVMTTMVNRNGMASMMVREEGYAIPAAVRRAAQRHAAPRGH